MNDVQRLVALAGELVGLGTVLEEKREVLKTLVGDGVPYDSLQMLAALRDYQNVETCWNDKETEYLSLREKLSRG